PPTVPSTPSVTTTTHPPARTYTLTLSGDSATLTHTSTLSLHDALPISPDFTLSASPSSQTVTAGGSTSYNVTISPTGGYTGQVTLNVSALATEAHGSFTSNPAPASSTLAVTTSTSTPAGTYTLTLTGVS